jgi:hypothetical protein
MKHPPRALFRGCDGRCPAFFLPSSLTSIHLQVNVDLQDSEGKTPMHVAAGIGFEWGVKALLDADAKVDIKDKMDRSVIKYAEQKGQRSCAQAIREAKTQSEEEAQAAASPLEIAVKKVIDEDDAQQLYEVLQQHAKMGRIELESIIDKLYDGLRGLSCLHRYHRHK